MAVFAETAHDGEDDRLTNHLGQSLDEIHAHVSPYRGGYRKRQKQSRWMKVLRLVTLAGDTSPDIVTNGGAEIPRVEVATKLMKRTLHPFMTVPMNGLQDFPQEWRRWRNVKTALECHHAINERPRLHTMTHGDVITKGNQRRLESIGVAQTFNEVKPGPRDGKRRSLLRVTAR